MSEFLQMLGYLIQALAHPLDDPILWCLSLMTLAVFAWGPLALVSLCVQAYRDRRASQALAETPPMQAPVEGAIQGPARSMWSSWYGWHTVGPDGRVKQQWHRTDACWKDYAPAAPSKPVDGDEYW